MQFFIALLTFFFVSVFALPPACLLHAVNTQDQPADLSAVCGSGALNVQKNMAMNCGSNASAAQSAFIATCSAAGTKVAVYTASSTVSSSATSSSKSSSGSSTTGTGMVTSMTGTASGTRTGSATVSGTSNSANIKSTGAAAKMNVNIRKNGRGAYSAAAIALVGAVAAL